MKPLSLFAIIFLGIQIGIGQSPEEKYVIDIQSMDAIINAYYDVVSGSADDPWHFERDKYIHSEHALIRRFNENGKVESYSLDLFPKAKFI